jgi:hypothetical protein
MGVSLKSVKTISLNLSISTFAESKGTLKIGMPDIASFRRRQSDLNFQLLKPYPYAGHSTG